MRGRRSGRRISSGCSANMFHHRDSRTEWAAQDGRLASRSLGNIPEYKERPPDFLVGSGRAGGAGVCHSRLFDYEFRAPWADVHKASISSSDFPFVSGTTRQVNKNVNKDMKPKIQKVIAGPAEFSMGGND